MALMNDIFHRFIANLQLSMKVTYVSSLTYNSMIKTFWLTVLRYATYFTVITFFCSDLMSHLRPSTWSNSKTHNSFFDNISRYKTAKTCYT